MPPAPNGRCAARSKQTGRQCGSWPAPGKNVCHHHGGAPGSGGPPHNRLFVRHLTDDQREAFWRARQLSQLDRMDDTIALAVTQLDAYLGQHGLSVSGGQVVSLSRSGQGQSVTHELHVSIVLRHLDQLQKLERARAKVAAALGPVSGEFSDVDRWLGCLADADDKPDED